MSRIQNVVTKHTGRLAALLMLWAAGVIPAAAQQSAQGPDVPDQLDLNTAIIYAVEHNFAILQARERIREQEGMIVQVKAQVLPNANVGASYSLTDKELTFDQGGGIDDTQNWSVGITVSQLLYSGGGVSAALKAQKSLREAALLDLEATINQALLDVRTRFYNVLLAREQIKVQEQNVQLLEEQLTIAKNRFDAGASSSFEVLRAEVSVANAQPGLIRARNGYRIAIDQLRQSLGYVNTDPQNLKKAPDFVGNLDVSRVNFDLASSIATARENRAELKRFVRLSDAGEAGVKAAKSGYQPTLSAVGGYTVRKDLYSRPINGVGSSLDGWSVGLQANWAVFDGRATAGKVAQARSQLEQTRIYLSDATLAVEVEVRQAFSALQEAAELVDAAQKVVSQAEEALRLADSRYAAGTATQLDVLTSRLSLTESRMNQLQANYSYNVAVASLRKAIGQADPVYLQP